MTSPKSESRLTIVPTITVGAVCYWVRPGLIRARPQLPIRAAAGESLPFLTDAGLHVALDAYVLKDGRRATHLLNYRNEDPVPAVRAGRNGGFYR